MKNGIVTLSIPAHGWGSITAESNDNFIFFFRDLPKGVQLAKDQRVQFETENCGRKGLKAVNIEILPEIIPAQ